MFFGPKDTNGGQEKDGNRDRQIEMAGENP